MDCTAHRTAVAHKAGRRQAGRSKPDATLLHSGQAASQLSCKLLYPCPVLATYAISVGASQALSFTSPCASAASKMEAATRPGLRDTRQRSVADRVSINARSTAASGAAEAEQPAATLRGELLDRAGRRLPGAGGGTGAGALTASLASVDQVEEAP